MTTQAPLRSRWTKAESVYHVRVWVTGILSHLLCKDTRLFPVACTRLFGWERPRVASEYSLSLNLVRLLGLLPHGSSHHVAPLPAPT